MRNKFDKRDSLEMGNKAERRFAEMAKSRGWGLDECSAEENMNGHCDFILFDREFFSIKGNQHGIYFGVEIKGMKRVSRSDRAIQNEWTWIELHGVRKNDKGWLYGTKAAFIAFEQPYGFLFLEVGRLIGVVEDLVSDAFVSSAREAKYKCYRRPNRHDIISMIETEHLLRNAVVIWKEGILRCDKKLQHAAAVMAR